MSGVFTGARGYRCLESATNTIESSVTCDCAPFVRKLTLTFGTLLDAEGNNYRNVLNPYRVVICGTIRLG